MIYARPLIIFQHPLFDPFDPYMKHDLCLMELDGEIDVSNRYIDSVPLAEGAETFAGNDDCWISGWGKDGNY